MNAIILDLGGVILNIDYHRTEQAFMDLGFQTFGKSYSQLAQGTLFDDFEKGLIPPAKFRDGLRQLGKFEAPDAAIDQAWNAMLLELPPARLESIETLKKRMPVFLLSNTNEIHMQAFSNYLRQTFGVADLSGSFTKVYLSYKVRMRKPDAEIFKRVLEEHGLAAQKTLFIDDSEQHVMGARTLELQTHHLRPGEELSDILAKFN